jgi:MFS family permease
VPARPQPQLSLAAALLGVGVGALLVPPLVDRAGWRICLAATGAVLIATTTVLASRLP